MSAPILLPTGFFLLCSAALTLALPALMEAPAGSAPGDAAPRADRWPQNDGGDRASHTAPIRRHADGLFYAVARVNGAPVRFLVDTGSSVVILAPVDARRAGVDRAGPPSAVRTAAGTATMERATLASVTVAGRTLHDVDAAVAPASVTVSLMGQAMLSRLGSLRIEGDSLTFD